MAASRNKRFSSEKRRAQVGATPKSRRHEETTREGTGIHFNETKESAASTRSPKPSRKRWVSCTGAAPDEVRRSDGVVPQAFSQRLSCDKPVQKTAKNMTANSRSTFFIMSLKGIRQPQSESRTVRQLVAGKRFGPEKSHVSEFEKAKEKEARNTSIAQLADEGIIAKNDDTPEANSITRVLASRCGTRYNISRLKKDDLGATGFDVEPESIGRRSSCSDS
jgi:hypothetical protein